MASTVLPNGIIIPEKYSRDWYNDLYHNWQELDNLLAGGGANDGTLTIQKNGTTVGTFSANQATDETIDISVPTKTSDLTNDSNFVASTDLATVATSGSYNDLDNKPTIPTKTSDLNNDSGFITSDDTKIPLAGSNQISGDLIPSTDGTVNLGSPSYQWNNAYATTFNGDVVGRQNLTLRSNSGLARIFLRNDEHSSFPNSVNIYSTVDNVEYGVFLVGSSFFPTINGEMGFGYSQRRWKDCYTNAINGLNPGALSFPSMNFISLDTTNFDVTATTIGTLTPTVDGWAILSMSQKNKHFGIWILNAGYRATFHSVYHDGDYMIFALMPVRANVTMNVYCTAGDIDSTRKIVDLRLFPCQGNV